MNEKTGDNILQSFKKFLQTIGTPTFSETMKHSCLLS